MPTPLGDRPMTAAERQARRKERLLGQIEAQRKALIRIQHAKTVREAREVAATALQSSP
jgi:hypothetical protein